MARVPSRPLSVDALVEEIRFLLKTLLRDDLFGDEVSLTEAEKLLESSLSLGFVEYCAFLKRHAFLDIDRVKNTVTVLPRGRNLTDGGTDPSLHPLLAAHFARQIDPARPVDAALKKPPRPGLEERPAASAVEAQLQHDRYLRGVSVGQGTLGGVWLGRDGVLERDVVIKEVKQVFEFVTYVPRDELLRRVREAVMSQARLDHPHVLRVVDVSWSGEHPQIVLERAHGSLRGRMRLPVDIALRLIAQVCAGLGHAHSHGVVHGSLKPENVLIDVRGNVRLADFGLARATERPLELGGSTPPIYVGSAAPSYMAPEQLHQGSVGAAGDIYATGILLYELLTEKLPGRRSKMPSEFPRVVDAVGQAAAVALDDVFDRMTRDDVEERFASIREVQQALQAALSQAKHPAAWSATGDALLLWSNDPLARAAVGPSDGSRSADLDLSDPTGLADIDEASAERLLSAEGDL